MMCIPTDILINLPFYARVAAESGYGSTWFSELGGLVGGVASLSLGDPLPGPSSAGASYFIAAGDASASAW